VYYGNLKYILFPHQPQLFGRFVFTIYPFLIACTVNLKGSADRFLCFSLMKSTKNQGLRKKKLKISLSGKNEISSSSRTELGKSATYQPRI
jgi:hypothetical protein